MYCTNCGTKNNDSTSVSGTIDVPTKKPKRKIIISAVIAVLILVVAASVFIGISPENKENNIETAVNEFIDAIQ